MPARFHRRELLQAMLAAGCGLAGISHLPARAAAGRVLVGFPRSAGDIPLATAVLREIQQKRSYEPDLGADLVHLAGAGGAVAINAVLAAPADGATVLLAPSSMLTLLPQVRPMPNIDLSRDLVPIAALASIGLAFAVGRSVPAKVNSLKTYAAWVRDNPDQRSYGIPGQGTMPHFIGTLLGRALDLVLKPVVYSYATTIAADLASGSLPAGFIVLGADLQSRLDTGTRLLAVTSAERWPALPDVATMLESGVGNLPPPETFGFFAAARTPASRLGELGDAIEQALRSAAAQAALSGAWILPAPKSAENYAIQIAQERASWAPLIKFYRFPEDI